ncbi:hypothetical protein MTP99_013542 [Tenebrio molitor]|nr:hypothetical protein MTP99_013542 [Tenebrio molitor]
MITTSRCSSQFRRRLRQEFAVLRKSKSIVINGEWIRSKKRRRQGRASGVLRKKAGRAHGSRGAAAGKRVAQDGKIFVFGAITGPKILGFGRCRMWLSKILSEAIWAKMGRFCNRSGRKSGDVV